MSHQPQSAMSDAEREVLNVLWARGPLGVKEVLGALVESGQAWTRSTVVTLLRRLEAKGYIASDRSQYAFVYRPLISREDVIHARLSEVADELADGQAVPLMLAFVERQRFSAEDVARLQEMLDAIKSRTKTKRRTE